MGRSLATSTLGRHDQAGFQPEDIPFYSGYGERDDVF